MVLDPGNEEIMIRVRRAHQSPLQSPNIPLLFQHNTDISSSNKDVGKLQTKTQVCHIPSSLTKNEKQQKDEKDAPDTGVP